METLVTMVPPRRLRLSCRLVLAACLVSAGVLAQAGVVTLPPDQVGIKRAQPPLPRTDHLTIPAPPRSLFTLPAHRQPPIPLGTGGNPEPRTPPSQEVDRAAPLAGTGAFTFFKNTVVQPAGASRSTSSVVEPAAVNVRDTSFQVGNWYAALSRDTGQTWTHIDPSTFFGLQLDAGFCCDQRIEYIRSHDITVWLQQFGYSASTQKGSYVLAVANGRDELRSGNPADWTVYVFDPTDFGYPPGTWLDMPDIGFTDDWFHVSANVFDSTTTFVGAVRWRLSLNDLQANVPLPSFSFQTSATMGGSSYRFASRAGTGSDMFWATLMNTTTIRVFRQPRIGAANFVDRTIAPWQWTFTNNCAGPDARGWLGTATRNPIGWIRGACGNATEVIFAWTSDGNGGTRPYPYTRVERFRVSDRTLIAEHDIFSTTDCWAYAALDSNTLGDIGGVIAIGGPNRYVRTSGFLIDQYENGWSGVIAYRMGDPTNNPPGQLFGDYFDVQQSATDGRTFIGTGNFMDGGDQNAHVEPHYAWFGRNDYEPAWVTLDVTATGVVNVPIVVDVTDHLGRKNGTTPFARTFAPNQGYQLTAPLTQTSGGTVFEFHRWVRNDIEQAIGLNVTTQANMGSSDDTAVAQYRARRTITFDASGHVGAGVPITVSPSDLNGRNNGNTPFSLVYKEGYDVTMTAPASVGPHPFHRWRVGTTDFPAGLRSVTSRITADVRAAAVYLEHTAGSFTAFGRGCDGSNGPDLQTGAGTPEIGQRIEYRLQGGPLLSGGLLVLGFSNTSWSGVPLPLPIPGTPCLLNVAFDTSYPASTDATGRAALPLVIPRDTSLIGGHVFTQFLSIDLRANLVGITLSNGLDTVIGGAR